MTIFYRIHQFFKTRKASHQMRDAFLIVRWNHLGVTYGYPPCCIKAFVYRISNQISDSQKGYITQKELKETGFIPCKECSQKPVSVLVDYINEHRIEKSVFPDSFEIKD